MTDAHIAAKALMLSACREASVAAAAGIGGTEWVTRVQAGDKDGFIAGLHRGRLPAVEVFQKSDRWTLLSMDDNGTGQGTMSASWVMRVHSGLPNQDLAEDQCRAVAYAALIQIRSNRYFTIGDDVVSNFDESPLGYSLEVALEVVTAMGRDTYETTPGGSTGPVPDGGPVGGISVDVNWDDASPRAILAVPAGQAIGGIQARVVTPFDGAAPNITVGIDGDEERYLAYDESVLTQAGSIWEKDSDDIGPKTVKVWITPGLGCTQGVVRIQITCTGA